MPDPVKDLGCEVMFSRTDGYGFYRKPAYALTSFGVAAFASFATLERRLACPAEAREASEGWWSQTGSNRRPHACKARALPAELWPRNQKTNALHSIEMVGLGRLELPTSRLSSARSNQLSYKPISGISHQETGNGTDASHHVPDSCFLITDP